MSENLNPLPEDQKQELADEQWRHHIRAVDNAITLAKDRLQKAQAIHKQERESEFPDLYTKQAAWGKMVAYAYCLSLLTKIKNELQ